MGRKCNGRSKVIPDQNKMLKKKNEAGKCTVSLENTLGLSKYFMSISECHLVSKDTLSI